MLSALCLNPPTLVGGCLVDIISNIIEVYTQLSEKFETIEKTVKPSVSKDIDKFKFVMSKIQSDCTLFDILLQYKQYFEAVKDLKNKIDDNAIATIIDDLEKTTKTFFKKELTQEMRVRG